ncbi:hypothetical protein Cni_G19830 [Canna indica]|uniref:SCP domain-containing protein n=1 Tax=Canna indica TaxID=4628 RepID=A0AAQ3QH99_9LILI|nr:hypothetical protein Cni_G19830 [Canna indica]
MHDRRMAMPASALLPLLVLLSFLPPSAPQSSPSPIASPLLPSPTANAGINGNVETPLPTTRKLGARKRFKPLVNALAFKKRRSKSIMRTDKDEGSFLNGGKAAAIVSPLLLTPPTTTTPLSPPPTTPPPPPPTSPPPPPPSPPPPPPPPPTTPPAPSPSSYYPFHPPTLPPPPPPPPTESPVPPSGGGFVPPPSGRRWRSNIVREFLLPHNQVRAALGEPALAWNKTLARFARRWAETRRGDCAMIHSSGPYGENLFWGSGWDWTASQAVLNWAEEMVDYNRADNSCTPGKVCGHFTQIVWNSTTTVGCARVECYAGGVIITCNYHPPGNWLGESPFHERY